MSVLKEGVVGGALNLYFIYKFLRILTTPWESTDAFKFGIVDEKGKILKKHRKLKTDEEKDSYTMMHRLVWKLKRLMEKIPFGKSRLASYAAALWLIKEEKNFDGTDEELQESFLSFLETDWKNEALILKENYEGDMDKKTYSKLKEGIDIKKASMTDVIKDFQSSDAPQFKGKSDKKKKEMAIAAKLSKEEVEIDEAPIWSIRNTKTGQKYSISKYQDDKKLDKIRKGGGDHKHAAHYKDGKLIDEASKLPPHLAKFFDKQGNLKPEVAARVAKGREKLNWKDVTPKGYGPKEEVEIDEAKDVVFTIFKIKWDAPSSEARKLPKTMKIKVPSRSLSSYEDAEDYISDKISDESGYTHMGFETKPEIDDVIEGYGGTKKWKKGQNKMKKAGVVLHKKDRASGYVEEIELDEATLPKQMKSTDQLKFYDKLKTGDTFKVWYQSTAEKGNEWREFKVTEKTPKKMALQSLDHPSKKTAKFYLYNRGKFVSWGMNDKTFNVTSMKEEVELTEKWEVGVVYHQDFGGGEISYFRADSLLKNRRWKGMAVDEYGGKQKKPRNITADEKTPGWEITPKNEIPKGLKEEVELDEHCGVCGEQGIDEKHGGFHWKKGMKLKGKKVKKLKDLRLYKGKPAKKPAKGHGSYSKYSDTSGGFSFLKKGSSGSGYVGAYNSAELDGTEIKEDEVDEASLGSMISKKAKKLGKASSGYKLYHKDFSSAMQHAYDHAKKKGHIVDKKEIDDKVATGPKKPSKGKTNRYELKAGKRTVMIQVANLDNKRYELNMYIEGVELDEKWKKGTYTITDVKTGKVLGKYNSGAKAQKAADDIFQKGDYDAVAVEVDEELNEYENVEEVKSKYDKEIAAFKKKGGKVKKLKPGKKFKSLFKQKGPKKPPRSEEVEIEEAKRRMPGNVSDYIKFVKGLGPNPEAVFDVKSASKWVSEIKKGIKAGWISIASDALGGEYNVSIMIKLTLEKEKDWPNNILHNASFGMLRVDVDGGMEMFASGHKVKNMRKTKVKSARDVVSKINTWIKKVEEEAFIPFSKFITEGRPKQDKDYVPGATVKDFNRTGLRALADAQKKHYSVRDIESIARKYKVKLPEAPVGGKTWDWDWEIVAGKGISLSYRYNLNSTFIKGWKFDKKKAETHLAKYGNEHETVRDMKGSGGKVQVIGLETAFELIEGFQLEEGAPANSVAAGNVNLDPFKKKRKNAKVQTEMFGGQKVFVVSPDRYFQSRLGKSRYARYEKYVGNDKLGEAIRQYGRNNPKNSIILKNSGNGAMLYLKYGRK